jgi:hypothetical protein
MLRGVAVVVCHACHFWTLSALAPQGYGGAPFGHCAHPSAGSTCGRGEP